MTTGIALSGEVTEGIPNLPVNEIFSLRDQMSSSYSRGTQTFPCPSTVEAPGYPWDILGYPGPVLGTGLPLRRTTRPSRPDCSRTREPCAAGPVRTCSRQAGSPHTREHKKTACPCPPHDPHDSGEMDAPSSVLISAPKDGTGHIVRKCPG